MNIVREFLGEYCQRISRLHSQCLPEYLRTFNYKLHCDLLPLNTKFVSYALDTDSRCYFCGRGPENEWHLFGKCNKLRFLWELLDEVVKIAFNENFSFVRNRTLGGNLDLVHTDCPRICEDAVVYLNTIVNHKIYKMRNEIKYNGDSFSLEGLFSKIIRSVIARKNIEDRMTETVRIDKIKDLCRALVFVKDLFFDQREQVR